MAVDPIPRRVQTHPSRGERLGGALLGLIFVGCGVWILADATLTIAVRLSVGVLLGLLGGNALYAAGCGRRSWLSRIGPLP